MDDLDYEFEPPKPSWRCEECGAEDKDKPLPKDRQKYLAARRDCPKCRKCGSNSLVPTGW